MRTDDPRAQGDRKQQDQDLQLEADNDLRAVLAAPAGRRFMWRLISDESLSYCIGADAATTAFREGIRQSRLEMRRECQRVSMKGYVEMVKEQLERMEARFPPPESPVIDE